MRRVVARCLALGLAVVAPVAAATPAWAPKYILGTAAYGDCLRSGAGAERFEGTLTPTAFSRSGSRLLVTGLLSGACSTEAGAVVATLPEVVATFPVLSVDAVCDFPDIGVMIRPGAQVSGVDPRNGAPAPFLVDLSRGTVLERSWTFGDPKGLRGQLCALDKIADRRPLPALAPVLNAFVRA